VSVKTVTDAGQQISNRIGSHPSFSLPTRLGETRNLPLERVVAQAYPTHAEATIEGSRPATEWATVMLPDGKFWFALGFNS
jgi:hypothetical protein